MSYEVVSYPLAPGIHQDAERTMAPPGTLIAATGCRVRKEGISKANGLVNAGVTAFTGDFSGPCDALGYAAGRQVAVMNGRAWAREDTGDVWTEVGRASRARPVKAHWQAFTDATTGAIQSTTALVGDFIAVAHYDGSGVQLAVMDPAGIRRVSATFSDRDRPRIFAVGSTFVLVMRQVSSVGIYAATINGTTLAVSAQTLVASRQATDDVYDAAPFSSTAWLLCYRSAATTFTTDLMDTGLGMTATRNVTVASNSVTACSVYGTSGENIFSAWAQAAVPTQQVAGFAPDLSSTTLAVQTLTTLGSATAPTMTRRDSTSVWIVFEETLSGPTRNYFRITSCHESSGFGVGVVAWHVRPASRPWGGDTTRMSIWLHTDGGTAPWRLQRRYTLATLVIDADVPNSFGLFLEPEFAPDERANEQQTFHLPEVAFRSHTDANGTSTQRGYFPALATIRTQNDDAAGTAALVLYEWETESGFGARGRQVAEVGGQGVVFGGGLQELPSARLNAAGIDTLARGVENGFVFAPAILSATATAGGSLTASALYQYYAVFEYVTPDGLRTRSAPSNLATVTPSGGNLTSTLVISTCPTSEREFSSPPNQTVVHVYGTTGGGSFRRITGDSGLSSGRGTSSTGTVTVTHSAADATIEDNEPIYTDREDANEPAPAHRFGWTGGGYAWVGGLFNPQLGERSKLSTPNEPTQFTRQNTSRFLLPEGMTAGAWMDGFSVVFSLTGIYLVSPTLGQPQRHPSTVGCIDHRSVVETRAGIGFQSRRGYEILPRGFGQPVVISGPVEDSLRGRLVISATVTGHAGSSFSSAAHVGENLLVLSAIDPTLASDPGVRLVYDLDGGRWFSVDPAMSDSAAIGEVLTSWGGRLVVASRSGTVIRYESPTDWGSLAAVPMSFTLADLRPFGGVLSRGQISRVLVLGEVRSSSKVTLTAYANGRYSEALPFEKPTQEAHGTAGDKFELSWQLPIRQCTALTIKIDVADSVSASPGECCVIHAIGVEASGLPGRPRISQERQAA